MGWLLARALERERINGLHALALLKVGRLMFRHDHAKDQPQRQTRLRAWLVRDRIRLIDALSTRLYLLAAHPRKLSCNPVGGTDKVCFAPWR